ncbi:MAG: hypothetical protein HZB12_00130 [Candidatus Yonathbacteria bacterium]|nr:hypothetical protein [Candidatus Yonathbacteria bacterium]
MRNLFLTIFFLFAQPAFAADLSLANAGFVQSNIWYSKDPFYAGDKVRIYTVIFNASAYDLTGAVEFFDNGVSLGKTNFSLSGSGRAQDLWVDWKASWGNHTITARLVNVIADGPNGKQGALLASTETGTSERVVDIDPVVKEAQAKLEAQKVTEAGAQALGRVGNAIQTVNDVIPAPIKAGVSLSANTLEQFRLGEGIQIRLAKEEKARTIDAIVASAKLADTYHGNAKKSVTMLDTASNATEKPFAYAMLAILSVLQFIFEWRIVFYGIIFYTFYRVVKWGIYKLRNR